MHMPIFFPSVCKKKLKLPPGGSFEGNTEFDGRQSIIINDNYPAMDILGTALEFRTKAYSEINSKFGFLWKIVEGLVMKNTGET